VSDVSNCPNCGSSAFEEVAPDRKRCMYCGTVLKVHKPPPGPVTCPHCGFENERGDRYCSNCGQSLLSWTPVKEINKLDPALLSIIVSLAGSFIMPPIGGIVGLVLGYRALKDAQNRGMGEEAEKRAKAAVVVGWVVLGAMAALPCSMAGMSGVRWGCSLCNRMFDELGSLLSDLLR
jgi:uncharacterized membrane protein